MTTSKKTILGMLQKFISNNRMEDTHCSYELEFETHRYGKDLI
ncbi:unnamed protein product [Paramecium octaurelia]|uniref:Uncharacterized protein n=1 Tax=Paramecium octaurelia TaxID=43137 RepID=A0A8S1VP18_PAROT|nr:unnamed protein product [Paramecium octaurelia]